MCTSFAVYSDKTVIGMNFYPAFGMNGNGTFINILMVDPIEEGNYRRGKNCIHIMKLFDEVLSGRMGLAQLPDFLDSNAIVNVPNQSVHSMIAGKHRETYIVEPGRKHLEMDSCSSNKDFMVLTNFPLSEYSFNENKHVKRAGEDRYIKAYDMIADLKETFNLQTGFDVLQETVQQTGDYPTQMSLVFIPDESKVNFTLNGDFTKVYEFSFITKKIQSIEGFTSNQSLTLSKKGVLLTELEGW